MVERDLTIFCGCLIFIKKSGDKKNGVFVIKKNAYHTIPIYGICMTRIFLMTKPNFFISKYEIVRKNFL